MNMYRDGERGHEHIYIYVKYNKWMLTLIYNV